MGEQFKDMSQTCYISLIQFASRNIEDLKCMIFVLRNSIKERNPIDSFYLAQNELGESGIVFEGVSKPCSFGKSDISEEYLINEKIELENLIISALK